MAPPLSRFSAGGTHYAGTQQFATSSQHQSTHASTIATSSNTGGPFISPGVSAFGPSAGGLLGLPGSSATSIGSSSFSGGVGDSGLGGPAARMGFAQAGNPHQHQHQPSHSSMGDHPARAPANKGRIREVWRHNLHEEFATIRNVIQQNYNYIAMDTEFPGIVARPMGTFRGKSDYHYQCLRVNVDLLNIIQIGITLFNENGETPPPRQPSNDPNDIPTGRRNAGGQSPTIPYTWQFNFQFSLKDDMYNTNSIESLTVAGLDFPTLEKDGIDPHEFAALLVPSGLVCDTDVKWISFHGGYDFGYLMKLLLCTPLPHDEDEFENFRKVFFPSVYDVKFLMKNAIRQNSLGMLPFSNGSSGPDPSVAEILAKYEMKQGLENIAEVLKIKRVGMAHQAGSDSLVTGKVFFQLRERVFGGEMPADLVGRIWGLGVPDILNSSGWNISGPAGTVALDTNAQNGSQLQHQANQSSGSGNVDGDTAIDSSNTGNDNATPSTPNIVTVGLASSSTPIHQHHANGLSTTGLGSLTPGAGTGVFGGFNIGGTASTTR